MDMSGYTPESIARTTRIDTITVGVLVAMASAGIIHVLLTRFDDIIAQVRKSAQEQMEVNKELRELQSTLEIRINERTAEVQARSEELARQSQELKKTNTYNLHRATQLQALTEVSRAIASISELDILLPTITRVIGDSFGFYHAGIFLADDAREFAVLSAANSEGGKEMLKRGHKLKIGQAGILGNVVASGSPRIVLDTGTDAAYLKNPDLPDTRSEMALPLRAGKQIIGALDVQSTEPSAFNEEDVEVLTTLADQVSIAIQNARLFDDAIRSAAENQVLLQQYARAQWSSLIKAQRKVGYRYFGKVEDIKERIEPESTPSTVGVPIMVRGQVIGTVSVRAAGGRRFNQDEMDIIRAATERAAIAAENARLLNDSQKRAAKEQTIGQISSKIGASVNLQNILQTAVEELGRTIPGTEVMIRFKKPS
ncbi:MAG: GAF domain-containing protein [Chloroflexi bacterium]|nr:MAG: GAF domain-containing protein [Chloroflexota bacterium]